MAAGLMAVEISTVPARGADARGSAPTPCLLFPDPEPAPRGSAATSEPWDASQGWSSPHGFGNGRHHQALLDV